MKSSLIKNHWGRLTDMERLHSTNNTLKWWNCTNSI